MKALDGTLRWIITPNKGKVYFLSPTTPHKNKSTTNLRKKDKYITDIQFSALGDIAYKSRSKNKEHFFVNGKQKSPENHQGLGPCIVDKKGRALMQLSLNNTEVLMLEKKVVSNSKAEAVGAWQLNPKGEVVLAQKINGKWGIYHKNKKISPECNMVWGWQITQDDHLIIPIEYKKGDNLILLLDGDVIYDGKGNILTWHYENKNVWVLAIEKNYYCFYKNKQLKERFPLSRGTLERWSIKNDKISSEFSHKATLETPRTCHPLQEYVATNEWWFKSDH